MVSLSIITMLGLGLVASILLAIASKVFFVQENPKVEAALEILPGANCGGCGFAGCEGYAKAVVMDPNTPANLCCASSKEAIVALSELTGKVVTEAEPLVSFRRCDVGNGHVAQRYKYEGVPSCAAVSLMRGGANTCSDSCLGFGDCVLACPFNALTIIDQLACVDPSRCTGCGICVKTCPRGILELIPQRSRVCVPCNSLPKGKAIMDICTVGCIKCLRCVKMCPAKAVSLEDGRIQIDGKLCLSYGEDCGLACVKACARHILRPIDLTGANKDAIERFNAALAAEAEAKAAAAAAKSQAAQGGSNA